MSERIEIDCQGMKCHQPIAEIAKAARTYPPATVLVVKAKDDEFESDVRAWAGTAKATIIRIDKKGLETVIELQLPG